LGLCDFIVANRPGIRPEALRLVIPPDLLGRPPARSELPGMRRGDPNGHALEVPVIAHLRRTTVYLLDNVSSEVSATDVRRRARNRQSIHGLVSARVEEYILKQGLYR
jgi:nicotinic acid mononucleotide adenylyltransferase